MEVLTATAAVVLTLAAVAVKQFSGLLLDVIVPNSIVGLEFPAILSRAEEAPNKQNENVSCSPEADEVKKIEYNFYVLDSEEDLHSILSNPPQELSTSEKDD